jgi:hypothetical protein
VRSSAATEIFTPVRRRCPLDSLDARTLRFVQVDQLLQTTLERLALGAREEVGEPLHRLGLALVHAPHVEERRAAKPRMPRLHDIPQHVEVVGHVVVLPAADVEDAVVRPGP